MKRHWILALVLVAHEECHFSLPRLHDDISSAADNGLSPRFLRHGHQCHVVFKVHVQKKRLFSLGEAPLQCEKAPIERDRAGPSDG